MSTTTRDEFLVLALDRARGMLKNLACRCGIDDWQDLRQEAAIDLLVSFHRIMDARNPRAYAHIVIRMAALKYIRTCKHMASLDEPILHDDPDATYAERLEAPAPVQERDHTVQDAKADALHQSLRNLPLEEQIFLREVYSLNSYNPVLPRLQDGTFRQPNYHRSRGVMSRMAYRRLRTDRELAAAIVGVQ